MAEIKEMKELVAGLELLLVSGKKVMADGKLGVADLPAAMELFQKMNVLIDAVVGIKEIPAEVKDLSQEEMVELVALMYGMVKKVKEA